MTTAEPPTTDAAPERAAPFDALARRYEAAYPDRTGQLEAGAWLLARLRPGARVIDLGCGTGVPTARQLAAGGLTVTGVDLSPAMLGLARRRVPAAAFHRIDLADVGTPGALRWGLPALGPAALGGFDGVTAFFSLMLLPRPAIPGVLRRVRELLRPDGLFALGMVEAELDGFPLPFLGSEIRVSGYLREDLAARLDEAGFAVEHQAAFPYAPASTEVPPEEQLYFHCRRR